MRTIGLVLSVFLVLASAVVFDESPCLKDLAEGHDPSGNWQSFGACSVPRPCEVKVVESTARGCTFVITTYGMYCEEVEGSVFQKLSIPSCSLTCEPWKPQLPIIGGFIEIPKGASLNTKVSVLGCLELSGYMVYPSQELLLSSSGDIDKAAFQFDEASYQVDAYYPDKLVSMGAPIQLRDHTVVPVSVHPIRFNPAASKLDISTVIEIELEYQMSDGVQDSGSRRLASPVFDEVCKDVIWNFDVSKLETSGGAAIGYLVICNDTFYSSMNRFVEWRRAASFEVTSVKLSAITRNPTDAEIRTYILHAFNTWPTPPTYVLLVGDHEFLPTHYGMLTYHQGQGAEPSATDNYYACVSGDDFFPDLFVGRLSVKSVLELNNVLDKIMSYNGFFNKKAAIISGPGYFEETSEWVCDLLTDEGYVCNKLYESLLNATVPDILDAVNEGKSILHYEDHGDTQEWIVSGFDNDDVLSLSNAAKYPIVISSACLTGHFDYQYMYGSDCLGEAWMKAPGKGAVAFIGSSRVASGIWASELSKGFYKALCNDNIKEFGPQTVKAKLYMYDVYKDFTDPYMMNVTQCHFELFNVLTDPALCSAPRTQRTSTHDVSILSTTANITRAYAGQKIQVNLVASNVGSFSETFNVTIYYGPEAIKTQTVTDLPPGGSRSIELVWDTSGIAEGNYTLMAVANKVPNEVWLTDNVYVSAIIELIEPAGPIEWVQYVPDPNSVTLQYRKQNALSFADVSVQFPSSAFQVSDFGTPTIERPNITVDAEIWDFTGLDIPKPFSVLYTYSLGELPPGNYILIFGSWGTAVKTTEFIIPITVPDDYSTIQAAINAANPEDLIYVKAGIYLEDLILNKTLSIVGENKDTTLISGSANYTVLNITASGVAISRFTIGNGSDSHPYVGICISGSDNVIHDNAFANNNISILLRASSNNRIYNNIITKATSGIVLENSSNNNVLLDNEITYTIDDAVRMHSSGNNTLFGNMIASNSHAAIYLNSANNNTLRCNTIANNSDYAIELYSSNDNQIYHNNFINNSQVSTYNSSGNNWDNGCEGNYWSDYNGTDTSTPSDGIGDSYLPWLGVDQCPLVNRYWDPSDINHDLKVDIRDIARAAKAFGSGPTSPRWNPHVDITGPIYLVPDRKVDIRDIALVAKKFGKTYT